MTLWLLMAALAGLAAFWLTRPLWQRATQSGVARATANVIAYQSRLAELEADIAAGVLPADEARAIQQEMDSRLLLDAAGEREALRGTVLPAGAMAVPRDVPVTRTGKLLPVLLSVLLCAFAGLWYAQAGSWRTAQQIASGPADDSTPTDAEIEGMVARLAERLATQPGDAEGWAMLGRSYFVMGRHVDAGKAYAEANALTQGSNADWLVGEGEALAMARDRDLLGRPAQLFEAALMAQPGYGKALWYGALADAQGSNFERAAERLQALLAQDLPDDLQAMVVARLGELQALAGGEPLAAPAAGEAQPAPVVDGAGAAPSAPVSTDTLTVQISLAPAMAAKIPANATLFVFAKAAPVNSSSPPMPLAVQKLAGARLPLTITLDDSMAMMPAMRLSAFERYVVSARYSANGTAIAAAGDVEGSAEAVRGQRQPVVVEINRLVP